MSCVKTRRLFVALWPDEDCRAALQRASAEWPVPADARRVGVADWHITLDFLGTVPEPARADIEALLHGEAWRTEPLVLDGLEWWAESGVGVICTSQVPLALRTAQAALRARLRALGLRVDDRPWRPHLTVARAMRGPFLAATTTAFAWPIRSIALVESSTAVGSARYSVLAAHSLI